MRRAVIPPLVTMALLASAASREQEPRSEPSPPPTPPTPPPMLQIEHRVDDASLSPRPAPPAPPSPIDPWQEPELITGEWGNRAQRRRAKRQRQKR